MNRDNVNYDKSLEKLKIEFEQIELEGGNS